MEAITAATISTRIRVTIIVPDILPPPFFLFCLAWSSEQSPYEADNYGKSNDESDDVSVSAEHASKLIDYE